MLQPLTERYKDDLLGVLSCFGRIVITGTLPGACHSKGMTSYLHSRNIKIFDYAKELADPSRNQLGENAHELAGKHGITIEHINKPGVREEDVAARVLKERGEAPGLVFVIPAMESCQAYLPWHDKQAHKTFLRATSGKCPHCYFYFMDSSIRPTWYSATNQNFSHRTKKFPGKRCLPSR